ncbi:LWR-salt protein [Haladaptatus sp. NG-SE-30]
MDARYVFAVRFRLDPTASGIALEPQEFETRLSRRADPPGEDGWLFFRDNLWRGNIGDDRYFRELTSEALGVPVTSVEYRAFETDEKYYEALQDQIYEELDEFKADSVSEVISKYLGSSVEIEY